MREALALAHAAQDRGEVPVGAVVVRDVVVDLVEVVQELKHDA